MERRFLPLWVLVAPRNPNPQASLRISLLDEERLLQLSQPGVSHLAQPGASFLAFALFMGISMSITAFPVLVRILQDRGIFKTSLGSTATACAAVDDVTAWSMLAFVVAIARATRVGRAAFKLGLVLYHVHALRHQTKAAKLAWAASFGAS